MKPLRIVASAVLAFTITIAARAEAQITLATDAGLFNAYVWRGLSLTNRFVLQPDAYFTIPAAGGSLVLLGWSSIDLGRYSDPTKDVSEGGGQASFDLTEIDLSAEYDHSLGTAAAGGIGAVTYLYPNRSAAVVPGLLTNNANRTVEVYGKLQATRIPLSPKLAVWYDVDKVKGAYFEGSLSQGVSVIKGFPLTLGVLAGLSAGQGVNSSKPAEIANFAKNSFTHLDFSASGALSLGSVTLAPTVHLYYLNDNFAKVTKPGTTEDVKAWAGVTLSWSKRLSASPTKSQ